MELLITRLKYERLTPLTPVILIIIEPLHTKMNVCGSALYVIIFARVLNCLEGELCSTVNVIIASSISASCMHTVRY